MMFDHVSLGPTPSDETCEQLGSHYDPIIARAECKRYIALIRSTLGNEPDGAILAITSNPHDFGTYLDVVCKFDPDIPGAINYAFHCESHAPTTWEG